jgi:hypothetical protein
MPDISGSASLSGLLSESTLNPFDSGCGPNSDPDADDFHAHGCAGDLWITAAEMASLKLQSHPSFDRLDVGAADFHA